MSLILNSTCLLREKDRTIELNRYIYLCRAEGDIRLDPENTSCLLIKPEEHSLFDFPDEGYHQAFEVFLLAMKLFGNNFPEILGDGMLAETKSYLKSI